MTCRRQLGPWSGVALAVLAATASLAAQGSASLQSGAGLQSGAALEVIAVRNGVHMIAGPNGNTTVQVGRDGVLVVDPQPAALSERVLAEIRKLSNKPVRYVVNTRATPTTWAATRPWRPLASCSRAATRGPRRCTPPAAPPSGRTRTC